MDIKVPTACVSGPGYGTLLEGLGRASGILGALSGGPSEGFWGSWRVLRRSPGVLEGPRGNPRASRDPWQGHKGAPGGYRVVLKTSCRVLGALLRVLWGALGAAGERWRGPREVLGGHWAVPDSSKSNFKIVEKTLVFTICLAIQATLGRSLGQLWVVQAGLGQLPGGRDDELSHCQAGGHKSLRFSKPSGRGRGRLGGGAN